MRSHVLAALAALMFSLTSVAFAAEVKLYEEGEGSVSFSETTLDLYFGNELPATLTMPPVTMVGDLEDITSCTQPIAECSSLEPSVTPAAAISVATEWLQTADEQCETPDGKCYDMDLDYVEAPPEPDGILTPPPGFEYRSGPDYVSV